MPLSVHPAPDILSLRFCLCEVQSAGSVSRAADIAERVAQTGQPVLAQTSQ